MDYKRAKGIRSGSLSDMILDKMASGAGVTSSVAKSISTKMSASATGIKEKFDPLNMVRFVTGGSKLATGIFGKLTGRSQRDIDYFTGRKRTASRMSRTRFSDSPASEGFNGASSVLLTQIYDFMVKSHDEDKKIREIQNSFQEEKENEAGRRHKEFIKVLKKYVAQKEPTIIKEREVGDKGIMSTIMEALKGIVSTIKDMFVGIFKFIENVIEKLLSTIISVVGSLIKTIIEALTKFLFKGIFSLMSTVISSLIKFFAKNLLELLARILRIEDASTLSDVLSTLGQRGFKKVLLAMLAFFGAKELLKQAEYTDSIYDIKIQKAQDELARKYAELADLDSTPVEKRGKSFFNERNALVDDIEKTKTKITELQGDRLFLRELEEKKKIDPSVDIIDQMQQREQERVFRKQDEESDKRVKEFFKDYLGVSGPGDQSMMEFIKGKFGEIPTPDIGTLTKPLSDIQENVSGKIREFIKPMTTEPKLDEPQTENLNLNFDQTFDGEDGNAEYNQSIAPPAITNSKQLSSSALVRDRTFILEKVFAGSVVTV